MIAPRNPQIRISENDRRNLEQYVASSVNVGPAPVSAPSRDELSDRIAVQCVLRAFHNLFPTIHATDANLGRVNQPGYDILLNRDIKVQVKGSTFVECMQWFLKPTVSAFDFDVLVAVDIGIVLRKDFGRLEKRELTRKDFVDFYVMTKDDVMAAVPARPRITRGQLISFYLYHRPVRPDSKEFEGQFFEMPKYLNRFDAIERVICP